MSLLTQLLNEVSTDLSKLPVDVVKELKSNITKGAKDLDQKWGNALDLVHKAYQVAGVQRPNPAMEGAWKDYEEIMHYAVDQLAKYRGKDSDWRMTSAVFTEAFGMDDKKNKFQVSELGDTYSKSHTIHAKSLDEVIDAIKKKNDSEDVTVTYSDAGEAHREATVTFSKWNIKRNYKVKIEQL